MNSKMLQPPQKWGLSVYVLLMTALYLVICSFEGEYSGWEEAEMVGLLPLLPQKGVK